MATDKTSVTEQSGEPVSFDVPTSKFLRLLAEVTPFAHTENDIPAINCVTFEFAGSDFVALATDRYTLGVGRLPIGQELVYPHRRVVRLSDIREMERMFRAAKGHDPTLCVEFGSAAMSVSLTATLDGKPTRLLAAPWLDVKPVAYRSLFGEQAAGEVADFNPNFLARFTKVQRDCEPITIHGGAHNKPWRITVGDHFVGLIMPVRKADGAPAAWFPAEINEPKPPAKPVRRRPSRKAAA